MMAQAAIMTQDDDDDQFNIPQARITGTSEYKNCVLPDTGSKNNRSTKTDQK